MDYTRPVQALIPGAQGDILAVLAETTAQLNLTTISRLAGVSLAQTSRVLPELVHLGIVERVEAPPSALFRLIGDSLVGELIGSITNLRFQALHKVGHCCAALEVRPKLAIVFGSFARGEADADSDVDLVVVRPDSLEVGDATWADSALSLNRTIQRALGNPVNIIEIDADQLKLQLDSERELWNAIRTEGVVVYGDAPACLRSIEQ